jgi:hypothetical protein
MAEEFEKKEHELFGEDGFEKMVDRVARIEQQIGIRDLNQFTPHWATSSLRRSQKPQEQRDRTDVGLSRARLF